MIAVLAALTAATPAVDIPGAVRDWVSLGASLGALGWIGRGIYKVRKDRTDGRVAARKDTRDAENDIVLHWKDVAQSAETRAVRSIADERQRAQDEREQKESAVRTVRELLELQEAQNNGLRDTISRLTGTITALTDSSVAQVAAQGEFHDELNRQIQALTDQRNDFARRLEASQQQIAQLTARLMRRQADLLSLPDTGELATVNEQLDLTAATEGDPGVEA